MTETAVSTDLVLIGGGHAHVFVLEAFAMKPEPGLRLTVIVKELAAPYSGMLPGYVAGHYTLAECHIDVVRLAKIAGARLIHGAAVGVDRAARLVSIQGQEPVRYDILSVDAGITPLLDGIEGAAEHAIAVKPVSIFAPKWQALEKQALTKDGPRRIAAIGGGAAGVELILAARHRLRTLAAAHGVEPDAYGFSLVAGGGVLPGHNRWAARLARRALARAGVGVIEGDLARRVTPEAIELASGRRVPADAVLVSTKAAPPAWFKETGMPLSCGGFLALRPTLQLTDDDRIFAAGDCADVLEHPREKAGVFAVRQGPPLAGNLRRVAQGRAARPFAPQKQFLTIVSLGGKRAIAARGSFAAAGAWVWAWKDRIDRAFMARFAG